LRHQPNLSTQRGKSPRRDEEATTKDTKNTKKNPFFGGTQLGDRVAAPRELFPKNMKFFVFFVLFVVTSL
jgi:hypothetical protein